MVDAFCTDVDHANLLGVAPTGEGNFIANMLVARFLKRCNEEGDPGFDPSGISEDSGNIGVGWASWIND